MNAKNNFDYLDEVLKEDFIAQANNSIKIIEKKLSCLVYDDAIFLPAKNQENSSIAWSKGGVVDQHNNYVKSSAMLANGEMIKHRMYESYEFSHENLEHSELREVIYLGLFINHYGHFLVEVISRLWHLIESPSNLPIVYTSLDGKKIGDHYLSFFELLGIDRSRLILIKKPTKFKKIIIPDVSVEACGFYTKEYKKIFDEVKNKVTAKSWDKVYFSRTKFKKAMKSESGEKAIELFMEENGFKIFYPEQLSLIQQIEIVKGCKVFAGLLCTIPHNLLFANDGVKAILFKKNYLPYPHQFMVNSIRFLDVVYVDCHISLFSISHSEGPYWIVCNENVIKFAKDFGYKVPSQSKITFSELSKFWNKNLVTSKETVLKTPGYDQYDLFKLFKYYYEKHQLNKIIEDRRSEKFFAIYKENVGGKKKKFIRIFNFRIKIKTYAENHE